MHKFFIPNPYPNEKIILLLRRHWFIILLRLSFWALVALLPLIFYRTIGHNFIPTDPLAPLYPILVLFTSTYYLYTFLFAFHSFVDYYLDVWIVTNQRIVNIEQRGLFSREVSEQKLFRIQDVTAEVNGFFPTTLDYGTVFIQTAGEKARFNFKQIPEPYVVSKKIILLAEQDKKYHRIMEASANK
ncbi:hypothetical protein CL634_09910 [bacterium]|nr:hypothetical protein [bacterium]